jgi:hypothetical protein
MATIDSKQVIADLLKNDGYFSGDPQVAIIYSYRNDWGNWTQAIFYHNQMPEAIHGMASSPHVHTPRILWTFNGGLTDYGKEWLVMYSKERGNEISKDR